jgi:hypothetical protein
VLGINGYQANESVKTVSRIYERLKNVKYVFLDENHEISMLDCSNMYTICAQMSMEMHVDDQAFGGKNMIFAVAQICQYKYHDWCF